MLSTQAPFWQTWPPVQRPGCPLATVPQVPLLHVWHSPVQLQHCALGMHTLLPQSRGAVAGQPHRSVAPLHVLLPLQPLLSQQAPAWSLMQRVSWQSTVPALQPQLPPWQT